MLQGIFPHDIGKLEAVGAFFQCKGLLQRCYRDTVLEDIVHSCAKPSLAVGSQLQLQLLGLYRAIGLHEGERHPDVFIAVSIAVPEHNVDVVKAGSVVDVEADLRGKLAAPGMVGDRHILFKYIYCITGRYEKETGYKEGKGQNAKQVVPFQWTIIFTNIHIGHFAASDGLRAKQPGKAEPGCFTISL